MWNISKENHSDLNFALGCLFCDAISLSEFKKWVELVICSSEIEHIPHYFYELIDFNEPLFHISKIIGFNVINDLSKHDESSIYGIAYLRNNYIYDAPINKNDAISYLSQNISILAKFKYFFPFIEEIKLI